VFLLESHLWGAESPSSSDSTAWLQFLRAGQEPVLPVAVLPGLLYSLVRVLLDAIATSQRDQTKLQAEVPALRRQV
jgi:hypothetical protein